MALGGGFVDGGGGSGSGGSNGAEASPKGMAMAHEEHTDALMRRSAASARGATREAKLHGAAAVPGTSVRRTSSRLDASMADSVLRNGVGGDGRARQSFSNLI